MALVHSMMASYQLSVESVIARADHLFTMNRTLNSSSAGIFLSFEVEPVNHNRMKLALFSCPEHSIYTPAVNVYTPPLVQSTWAAYR